MSVQSGIAWQSVLLTVLTWLSHLVSVSVIFSYVLGLIKEFRGKRLVSRFFGAEFVKIYFPLRKQSSDRLYLSLEDYFAATTVADFLRNLGMRAEVCEIPVNFDGVFPPGSVFICGPKMSSAVKTLCAQDPHYVLDERDSVWGILDKATGNFLKSPMDSSPPQSCDLAYVARRKTKDGGAFVLLAGVHSSGSFGAARYISNRENLREIFRDVKGSAFSMVVRANFDERNPANIQSDIFMPVKSHS